MFFTLYASSDTNHLHRIKQYFMELGCRVGPPTQTDMTKWKLIKAETANHFIAKLKLPLVFPRVGGPMKKKRG